MVEARGAAARAFIPGIELSRRYFHELVEPILARGFPHLRYAAALIGYGSEVQGFDDPMSTDHNWGPRLLLFLAERELAATRDAVEARLAADVPDLFLGWPTRMAVEDPSADDADATGHRPNRLRVEIHTVRAWVMGWLGIDADRPPDWREWLALPEQGLIEVTGGAVFRDDLGELATVREELAYFPRDVWLYKLACQWERIGQEQAFVGRCADAGDELGSRVIAARLTRDLMRLGFLVERRYAPYPKWFGAAFAGLPIAREVGPLLRDGLAANDRRARESALTKAARGIGLRHLELRHPGDFEPQLSTYAELISRMYGRSEPNGVATPRDYLVINAPVIAAALREQIEDPEIAALAPVGGVDQFSDSTDLLEWPRLSHAAARAVLVSRDERKRPRRG
jgi:hypothetical protein